MQKTNKLHKLMLLLIAFGLWAGISHAQTGNVGINTDAPTTTLQVKRLADLSNHYPGIIAPHVTGDELHGKPYDAARDGAFVYVTAAATDLTGQTEHVKCIGYYYYEHAQDAWMPFEPCDKGSEGCGCNPSTNGSGEVTYGQPDCSASNIVGTMEKGVPVVGVKMTVYAKVVQAGTYNILAGPTNGVIFRGSGVFAPSDVGNCVAVELIGIGTPIDSGTDFSWTTNTLPKTTAQHDVAEAQGDISSLNCAGVVLEDNAGQPVVLQQDEAVPANTFAKVPYAGGNGGNYPGATCQSTGVAGLTANLAAGTYASTGNLVYTITGTPNGSGEAKFNISAGSHVCTFVLSVTAAGAGGGGSGADIAALDCGGVNFSPSTATQGTAYTGTLTIPYTGGNGGSYTDKSVSSTGVTGLTATLTAGNIANGNGNLSYSISGTPSGAGTARFAIAFAGKSCNPTLTVTSTAIPPDGTPNGTGSFAGKLCFDIAQSNDNANGCGALTARQANKADFTQQATYKQTYTFTPIGTVSNVRFSFLNTNGEVIETFTADADYSGTNISTPCTATAMYKQDLNTAALGKTTAEALTADLYVTYNDSPNGTGTDKLLKLTPKVKDCACCGAKVSATEWKEFMCHNLGADQSLDPHDMNQLNVWGLQGSYIQWGKYYDMWNPQNNGNAGFAVAPIAGNANEGEIGGWSNVNAPNDAWNSGTETAPVKGVNDPCPAGYRVPTKTEWQGVITHNVLTRYGTWTPHINNYNTAMRIGSSADATTLTLPAAGYRTYSNGALTTRGVYGHYWSSTPYGSTDAYYLSFNSSSQNIRNTNYRRRGFSLRCVAE